MIGPNGEIFSAEDADSYESEGASRKKEGAFYVWTSTEVLIAFVFTVKCLNRYRFCFVV